MRPVLLEHVNPRFPYCVLSGVPEIVPERFYDGEGVTVPIHHDILRVYETGPLTVVGFGGGEIVDQIDIGECRDEIMELLEQHDCRTLAFDLTGVRYVPSGMLGLLASLRQRGIEVHLYNPSNDVREVLEITRLDSLFRIHELVV